MDFVLDRTADDHAIEYLTVVDDATHELADIEVKWTISELAVTRVMDRLALTRGFPC